MHVDQYENCDVNSVPVRISTGFSAEQALSFYGLIDGLREWKAFCQADGQSPLLGCSLCGAVCWGEAVQVLEGLAVEMLSALTVLPTSGLAA